LKDAEIRTSSVVSSWSHRLQWGRVLKDAEML